MKLGEVLLNLGLVDEIGLQKAVALQKERGPKLGEILIELGLINEEKLVCVVSEQLDIPRIVPHLSFVDKDLLSGLNMRFLSSNYLLPIFRDKDSLVQIKV
jgi:hypothetical protein